MITMPLDGSRKAYKQLSRCKGNKIPYPTGEDYLTGCSALCEL